MPAGCQLAVPFTIVPRRVAEQERHPDHGHHRFPSNQIGARTALAVWEYFETSARDELNDVKPLAVWAFDDGVLFTKDAVLKNLRTAGA
jgi:hypothetical protein